MIDGRKSGILPDGGRMDIGPIIVKVYSEFRSASLCSRNLRPRQSEFISLNLIAKRIWAGAMVPRNHHVCYFSAAWDSELYFPQEPRSNYK
jgi:hypothetical protein